MQHLDEGTIHAWLDDALPGPEREAVAEHVAHCPECATAVADARGMIAGASRILSALDDVPGRVLPRVAEGKRKRSAWRALHFTPARAALAASLMVAVAGALAVRYQRSGNTEVRPPVPAVAAPSAAPSPAAPSAASSAPPPRTPAPAAHQQQPAATAAAQTFERRARTMGKARPESLVAVTATGAASVTSANAVPGGAPTAKPRPAPADSVESAARAAPAPRIAAMRSTRRMDPVFADASMQPRFTGCYEISNDSALRSFRIPARFALQRAAPVVRGGAMRYPAVALTSDGRVDSLANSGTWRAVDDNTAAVSWVLDSTPTTLTIHFTAPQMTGELATPTRTMPVSVGRIDCHY